jgi:2-oxo-hept-3-ene-1,7-dioate hydratase
MRVRAEAFLAKQPVAPFDRALTMLEGYCAQALYVSVLQEQVGGFAGYKVSFVSPAAQAEFNIAEPARGVLLRSMLLQSGSELPVSYGVNSLFEADILVVVGDVAIDTARTPLEVAKLISDVRAFIEVADFVVSTCATTPVANIVGVNIFARYGVMGAGVRMEGATAFVDALAGMTVTMQGTEGQSMTVERVAVLLRNPLNVVLWLTNHLRQSGGAPLKSGDVVSLGSFGKLQRPKPGRTVILRYDGLPTGVAGTSIRFQ